MHRRVCQALYVFSFFLKAIFGWRRPACQYNNFPRSMVCGESRDGKLARIADSVSSSNGYWSYLIRAYCQKWKKNSSGLEIMRSWYHFLQAARKDRPEASGFAASIHHSSAIRRTSFWLIRSEYEIFSIQSLMSCVRITERVTLSERSRRVRNRLRSSIRSVPPLRACAKRVRARRHAFEKCIQCWL